MVAVLAHVDFAVLFHTNSVSQPHIVACQTPISLHEARLRVSVASSLLRSLFACKALKTYCRILGLNAEYSMSVTKFTST